NHRTARDRRRSNDAHAATGPTAGCRRHDLADGRRECLSCHPGIQAANPMSKKTAPKKTWTAAPSLIRWSSTGGRAHRRIARARLPAARRALSILGGLLLLIVAGTVVLLLPISGAQGSGLPFQQALFTTVSAVTGTGLSIITPAMDLSFFGQVILLLLMEIGGLGFVMTSIIVFRLLGRRVTLAERL